MWSLQCDDLKKFKDMNEEVVDSNKKKVTEIEEKDEKVVELEKKLNSAKS